MDMTPAVHADPVSDIAAKQTPLILAVNGGSSSIKYALFTLDAEPTSVCQGSVASVGTAAAVDHILDEIDPHLASGILAGIVHRVVHGGERFERPQRVTMDTLAGLRALIPLAPNHLPDEIALIEAGVRAWPDTPQVVCFDTAFHRTLPLVSHTLPVPEAPGLRRYGFHGLSYAYLLGELERVAGPGVARGRVVLAHLGSGASLAAVVGGRCVDTTMGLTPAGGLVMSSRSGDLDPGVVAYLARLRNLSLAEVDHLLTHQSGLRAISGRSGDMQELLALERSEPRARLAVDIFCYQVRKGIGAFAAALGGLDCLVFSGGIGEHAAAVRIRICRELSFLGVQLVEAQNATDATLISAVTTPVQVRVIPTNEELMMAREAHAVLTGSSPPQAMPTP
jgi:acetate kinase